MNRIPKDQWEQCPYCQNEGSYVEGHPVYGGSSVESMGYPILIDFEVDQIQCEFCWTNPKSVFYQVNKLWEKENG